MEKRLVNIIVVSYNAEKYIEKTLKSCLDQTYKNFEILLLDNNSKDRTADIVRKIEKQSNQLKVFESKKNLGPYGGLNFLLNKARGEYIAIQDHDDIWFPEKIEKQVNFLEKNKDFIACGANTFYYYESKNILILNKKRKITDFVDHTSLMFRNKKFRYDSRYLLADEYFEKKILSRKGKIACIQEPLVVHRIRRDGANLSSSRFKFSFGNIKEFFQINKFNIQTVLCLINLVIPTKFMWVLWYVSKKLMPNRNLWIKYSEFIEKYGVYL